MKSEMAEQLRILIENMSEEELEEMRIELSDDRPKGWLNIDEHLPMMSAQDMIDPGYSVFLVRDKDGNEYESSVCDHDVWYYEAKNAGITHWLNK